MTILKEGDAGGEAVFVFLYPVALLSRFLTDFEEHTSTPQ